MERPKLVLAPNEIPDSTGNPTYPYSPDRAGLNLCRSGMLSKKYDERIDWADAVPASNSAANVIITVMVVSLFIFSFQ